AAFNIASALIMMVMEKTKDIAVLKAMGATNRCIRNIFIIQGMIIGFLGTLTGTSSGVLICYFLKKYDFIQLPDAYPFTTLPVQLETLDVFMISVSAIVICFFSTVYPAHKASKMDPVEAIRYG
ncbi:MAG: FtsX-like permease family protein, partial [Pseudomonadota bacterium]